MYEFALLGWAVKPIVDHVLEQLGEATQDAAKDWFGETVIDWLKPDARKRGIRHAVTAFVRLFENELAGSEQAQDGDRVNASLTRFLDDPVVRRQLGRAIAEAGSDEAAVDVRSLRDAWQRCGGAPLPADFRWSMLARRYDLAAQQIVIEDEELRQMHDSRQAAGQRASLAAIAGGATSFDLLGLARSLRARHGSVRLDIIDAAAELGQISLRHLFVEQRVRYSARFSASVHDMPVEERHAIAALGASGRPGAGDSGTDTLRLSQERRRYLSQSSLPASRLLEGAGARRTVILGDPGSGKSALLAWKALRWADPFCGGHVADGDPGPVPLLIEVRALAHAIESSGSTDVLTYLDRGPGVPWRMRQAEVARALAAGEACVMLDGLDEVFDAAIREQIVGEAVRLSIAYPDARITLTSRLVGFERHAQALRDAGFEIWVIQELDAGQQDLFIDRWHRLACVDTIDGAERAASLRRAIASVPSIGEMAGNPLLLTLMALLNRQRELPNDRNMLFERASALLLDQWESGKFLASRPDANEPRLDLADQKLILRAVALRMYEDKLGNAIPQETLEAVVRDCLEVELDIENARRAASALVARLRERSHVLCLVDTDRFAFVHRGFLEFFCASAWVRSYQEAPEHRRITLDTLRRQTFEAHWDDDRWSEVLHIIISRLDLEDAERLLLAMLDLPDIDGNGGTLWLVASCREALRHPGRATQLGGRLATRLAEVVAAAPRDASTPDALPWPGQPSARQRALLALSRLRRGQGAMKRQLLDTLTSSAPIELRLAAIKALARDWAPAEDVGIALGEMARRGPHPELRLAAMVAVDRGWRDDPSARALLLQLGQEDAHWAVRRGALLALARSVDSDAEVRSFAWSRLQGDASEHVRRVALETIRGDRSSDEALPVLERVARVDPDPHVRGTALSAMVERSQDDAVRDFFDQRIQAEDGGGVVQLSALAAMARTWPDERTRRRLFECLELDTSQTRCAALEALVRTWPDDPDLRARVEAMARDDADTAVRQCALRQLAHAWRANRTSTSLLGARAREDADAGTRAAAVNLLASNWPTSEGTLALARECLARDPSEPVRLAAMRAVVAAGSMDSELQDMLASIVANDPHVPVRQAALNALLELPGDAGRLVGVLADIARTPGAAELRLVALQNLARLHRAEPSSFDTVLAIASDRSDHVRVRRAAIRELAGAWSADARTALQLRSTIRDDDDWSVRRAALQELAHAWSDSTETVALLRERAMNDPEANVRHTALRLLVQLDTTSPETESLLFDLAVADGSASVRSAAVQELANCGAPDGVREFLVLRAGEDPEAAVRDVARRALCGERLAGGSNETRPAESIQPV